MGVQAEVVSHIGKVRTQNQDRFLIDMSRGLFVICDGMGGHKGGEVAAQIAVDTLNRTFKRRKNEKPHRSLTRSIMEANYLIYAQSRETPEYSDMGTTITAALIEDSVLYAASVGDSILYVVNETGIIKVNEEHTLAQKMFREGILTEHELVNNMYSHVLTRALGVEEEVEIDCYTLPLQVGNIILLATDGLTDQVKSGEIREIIQQQREIKSALQTLTDLALERGGHDNITAIMITVF